MENQVTLTTEQELALVKAKQDAAFSLTPAGQYKAEFEVLQRMGKMYAESTIVPDTYKKNVGNCIIAVEMAKRMGAMPLMVMQNLYIVHGTPAFSTKFLVACINASGRFTPLRYEMSKKEDKCRCYAYERTDTAHSEPLYGEWVSLEMAEREGWSKKAGSKWLTMPGQMLRYRAAAFWCRIYCPELSMGLLTTEEAQDINADAIKATASGREAAKAAILAEQEQQAEELAEAEYEEEVDEAEAKYEAEAETIFS